MGIVSMAMKELRVFGGGTITVDVDTIARMEAKPDATTIFFASGAYYHIAEKPEKIGIKSLRAPR
jgi:uncharacterized protein YlzI (FlbEa/FlbD family)